MKLLILLCLALSAAQADLKREDWFRMWSHGGAGEWTSLLRKDVVEELKLSDEQKAAVRALHKEFLAAQDKLSETREVEDPKKHAKLNKEFLDKAKQILGPEKSVRWEEIHVTMLGNTAIIDKSIQDKLGLSDDQRSKVGRAVEEYDGMLSVIVGQLQSGDYDLKEIEEQLERMETRISSDCARIYTKEQAEKLMAMRGAPFKGDSSPLWWRMVRK